MQTTLLRKLAALLLLFALILPAPADGQENGPPQSLRKKMMKVQELIQKWEEELRDMEPLQKLVQEIHPLLKEKKYEDAEKVADKLLKVLENPPKEKKKDLSKYKRKTQETQYLIFILGEFMKDMKPTGKGPDFNGAVKAMVEKLGTTGTQKRKLGIMVGVPGWNRERYKQAASFIQKALDAAMKHDVAINFMIPTIGGWDERPDMWNYNLPGKPGYDPKNKNNVEWSDWKGTPYAHRYRDWGSPEELPPVICYNSPAVLKEAAAIVKEEILPVIKPAIEKLNKAGKENLFAGCTVGDEQVLPNYEDIDKTNPRLWEFMKKRGAKKARLGYNALKNKGYSKEKLPEDFAKALAQVNQEYVAYWAKLLNEGGIPKEKLYTHIAAASGVPDTSGLKYTNAPISIAFNKNSRPGWTTYASGKLRRDFSLLYEQLAKNGNPHWGGTECNPDFGGRMHPEEYLSRHYDYGCTVMIMNTGATSKELTDKLKKGLWNEDALTVFKKFLSGKPLEPKKTKKTGSEDGMKKTRDRIQGKIKKAHENIRKWRREGRDTSKAGEMLEEFESLIKKGKIKEAEEILDRVLKLLEG